MSLLDDVSIVVTPNGYKAGTLYGVIPSSGAADMDVTRATAGTRVDENGLVNYAEALGSEIADITSGTPVDASNWANVTSNSVDFTGLGASGVSYYNNLATGLVSGETYIISLTISNFSGSSDLGVSSQGGVPTSLRFSNDGTETKVFTSDGSNIRIFGRAGTNTATFSNFSVKKVHRDNVPRIDYTGGGCPHILAEPQRTNFIPYSEDFPSWYQIQNTNLTPSSTTSPSGDGDGTKFLSTSTGAKVRENFSAVSGTTYTLSVYCKNIDATLIMFLGYDGVNSFTSDLTSEVNTSTWTRISLTFTAANTGSGQIQIARDLPNGESVYFWGAQLEEGSYPTSYIPTSGSTVTRNQDIFTRDGIGSLINSTEGVLFLDMAALSDDGTNRVISLYSDSNNRVSIFYSITSNTIFGQYVISGSSTASLSFALSDTTLFSKIAFKYKENDFALWVDGVEVDTDSSGLVLSANTLNNLDFNLGNSTLPFLGKVKQLQVYDTALTDMQLIQLTGTAGTDFYESYSEMAESLTYTIQ